MARFFKIASHVRRYAGAIFAFGVLTVSAMVQAAPIGPQGGWTVTRMDQAGRSGPFCALTQPYANGMILTLGRNMTEEYSLAVDFQKPALDRNKPYLVELRPGPGQTRSMELMPISDQAVIVRLGWDESFFEALNVSQVLNVRLDGQSYDFSLPEIRSGQEDLGSCIDGLKERVAPSKTDILAAQTGQAEKGFAARRSEPSGQNQPAATPPAQTSQVLAREVAPARAVPPQDPRAGVSPQMTREITALRSENENLKTRLAEEKKRFDRAFVNNLQNNEAQELREKISMLEKENQTLSDTIKSDAQAAQSAALEQAQRRFSEAEKEVTRLGRLLEAEREKAATQAAAQTTADTDKMEKTLVERTAELDRVRKELSDQKAQAATLQRRIQIKEEEITAIKTDMAQAGQGQSNEVAALRKQVSDLQQELEGAKASAANAQSQTQDVQRMTARIAELETNLETQAADKDALRVSRQAQDTAQGEVARLRTQIQTLTQQKQSADDQNKTLQTQLVALQNEVAQLKSRSTSVAQTSSIVAQQPLSRAPPPRAAAQTAQVAQAVRPGFTKDQLQTILARTNLGVSRVSDANGGYSWRTSNGLTGQAMVQSNVSAAQFQARINGQIEALKRQCNGDFASLPSQQTSVRAHYDIACVGGANSFSSSYVFALRDNALITIGHRTTPENMTIAMDARDDVVRVF